MIFGDRFSQIPEQLYINGVKTKQTITNSYSFDNKNDFEWLS